MKKITFQYFLTTEGQKTELIAGRDASRIRRIDVELTDEIINRSSVKITDDGKTYWGHYPFFELVKGQDNLFLSRTQDYHSSSVLTEAEALNVINIITDRTHFIQLKELEREKKIIQEREKREQEKKEREDNVLSLLNEGKIYFRNTRGQFEKI